MASGFMVLLLVGTMISATASLCFPKAECIEHTCCFEKNKKEEKCCRKSYPCTPCGCVCEGLASKCPAHSTPLTSVANVKCGKDVGFKENCAFTVGSCDPLCECDAGYVNTARDCTVSGRYLVSTAGGERCTLVTTTPTAAPSVAKTLLPTRTPSPTAAATPTSAAPSVSPGSPTKAPTTEKPPGFWVTWRILAIAGGGFLFFVILVIIIWYNCCRKKQNSQVVYDYSTVVNETW